MDSHAINDLKQFITTTVTTIIRQQVSEQLSEKLEIFGMELRQDLRQKFHEEFIGLHKRITYVHGEVADLRSEMNDRFDHVFEVLGDELVNHDRRITRLAKRAV